MIFNNSPSAIEYGAKNPGRLNMLQTCENQFRELSRKARERKDYQRAMNVGFQAQLCREAAEEIMFKKGGIPCLMK